MRRASWWRRVGAMVSVVLLASGCGAAGGGEDTRGTNQKGCIENYREDVDYFPHKVSAKFAKGWSVTYEKSYKVLETSVDAGGGHATSNARVIESTYVLLQCGAPEPELTGELKDATVIEIPTETMVDGGSVLYAAIEKLGVAESLVGQAEPFIGKTERPYLPEVAKRIDSGAVADLGYEVDYEKLANANPSFYTNYAGSDAMFDQIAELGVPTVLYFPYTESPLGSAEQLKFLSLFFNLEEKANELFAPIQSRYEKLLDKVETAVDEASTRPEVVIGTVDQKGDVQTRENRRFEPQLVEAAGGTTIPNIDGGGIATISLERFLDDGADADYWMDLTFFPKHETKAAYLKADPRLDDLDALHDGITFHRVGKRGNDYFLNGAVDVDRTLADLVSILHPDLLPDHELEYLAAVT